MIAFRAASKSINGCPFREGFVLHQVILVRVDVLGTYPQSKHRVLIKLILSLLKRLELRPLITFIIKRQQSSTLFVQLLVLYRVLLRSCLLMLLLLKEFKVLDVYLFAL